MRGEEVQVVGAVAAGLIAGDGYLCHPGTHNKWVRLRGGRIDSFRTVMTGELFSLLKKHSILADLLASVVTADASFEQGVRRGLEGDELLAELFAIRARVLLGKAEAGSAASFASGLLIGSDLRLGLRGAGEEEIVVMGRPELTGLFAAAVAIAGRKAREVDGEAAFLAGARHLAELVQ
jgi:2-dehydro-3-deoxygalactonokinase